MANSELLCMSSPLKLTVFFLFFFVLCKTVDFGMNDWLLAVLTFHVPHPNPLNAMTSVLLTLNPPCLQ